MVAPPARYGRSQTPMAAPLSTWTAVHRLLVVPVAGRHLRHVSQEARALNLDLYGVGTPAAVVRTFRPGGIILFSDNVSSVDQVREFTAGLQRVAGSKGYRLLIMTDQEGGRVSRLPGPVAESQPSAASYDGDAARARRDARLVGAAMRRMQVLVDLAPVADVNTVGDARRDPRPFLRLDARRRVEDGAGPDLRLPRRRRRHVDQALAGTRLHARGQPRVPAHVDPSGTTLAQRTPAPLPDRHRHGHRPRDGGSPGLPRAGPERRPGDAVAHTDVALAAWATGLPRRDHHGLTDDGCPS